MTEVQVTVPDGCYAGDEFTLEYEGTQLSVVCPDGCGPGDAINLSIDMPPGGAAARSVNVVVPDGCFSGMEFTVEFEGTAFNIAVPDGVGPGMELTVEVPAAEAPPATVEVTEEMVDEAFRKAKSRMVSGAPDTDILRWCLVLYCQNNGDMRAVFAAMGDDPAEALNKPTYCDTPEKFAANYILGFFKVRATAPTTAVKTFTNAMYLEAFKKAQSRMASGKPDGDLLRWCLTAYCSHNGVIPRVFAAMGDDPAEALKKPTYCDTAEKFAANYVLGYFKVRQ